MIVVKAIIHIGERSHCAANLRYESVVLALLKRDKLSARANGLLKQEPYPNTCQGSKYRA